MWDILGQLQLGQEVTFQGAAFKGHQGSIVKRNPVSRCTCIPLAGRWRFAVGATPIRACREWCTQCNGTPTKEDRIFAWGDRTDTRRLPRGRRQGTTPFRVCSLDSSFGVATNVCRSHCLWTKRHLFLHGTNCTPTNI